MRPIYETDENKADERGFMQLMESKGFDIKPAGKQYPIDFIIKKDGHTAVAEYKRRHHNFGTYPTVIMPLMKFTQGRTFSMFTLAHYLYYCEFNDGVYRADITNVFPSNLEVTGRKDRGDKMDLYPHVHLPINLFRRIK